MYYIRGGTVIFRINNLYGHQTIDYGDGVSVDIQNYHTYSKVIVFDFNIICFLKEVDQPNIIERLFTNKTFESKFEETIENAKKVALELIDKRKKTSASVIRCFERS